MMEREDKRRYGKENGKNAFAVKNSMKQHIFRIRHSIMEKRKMRKSRKGMSRKKGRNNDEREEKRRYGKENGKNAFAVKNSMKQHIFRVRHGKSLNSMENFAPPPCCRSLSRSCPRSQ